MFLSRLLLNPRRRSVRTDLHDCNQLKRTLLRAFPRGCEDDGGARAQFGVLYRMEQDPRSGIPSVIVQSKVEPDWRNVSDHDPHYLLHVPECKNIRALYAGLCAGQELRFRLRANPTRRVRAGTGGQVDKLAGKRVELQGEEEQIDWLARKGEQAGFSLTGVRTIPDFSAAPEVFGVSAPASTVADVRATPVPKVTGRSGESQPLTFGTAVFDGHLRITDADRFRDALEQGIGPAKAYGFGLLSIAPVR